MINFCFLMLRKNKKLGVILMVREELFKKLYDELLDQGFIDEHNYNDIDMTKREFIKSVKTFFQDYYILDQLHEIE